jgi:hypothetical protein
MDTSKGGAGPEVIGAFPDPTHIPADVVQRAARRLRNEALAALAARIFAPWRRRAAAAEHGRQA